jgi:Icc-related predicted phosphoesterase
VIRVAAVGDIHAAEDSRGTLRPAFLELPGCADVLLLAGDLTRLGTESELEVLLDELQGVSVPRVAVLGNHDHESDRVPALVKLLEDADIRVLEGASHVIDVGGTTLGIAGTKGFGGGFAGAHGSDFGEPEMKAFIHSTKCLADNLFRALDDLRTDARVALLHYAPVKDTLGAERLEIFPFLGSYLLAEAIDRAGADLVIHGHAHNGTEQGVTPGGIPVRNVALPVISQAYKLYSLLGISDADG